MSRTELVIQLIKVALGFAIGTYFVWWSLEVLQRLPVGRSSFRHRIFNPDTSPQSKLPLRPRETRPRPRVSGQLVVNSLSPLERRFPMGIYLTSCIVRRFCYPE